MVTGLTVISPPEVAPCTNLISVFPQQKLHHVAYKPHISVSANYEKNKTQNYLHLCINRGCINLLIESESHQDFMIYVQPSPM